MSAVTRISLAALAVLTSPNGTARNGATFVTNLADGGGIAVLCVAAITTSSAIATFKLQGTIDGGTTWVDIADKSVATAAGTGSPVTTRAFLMFDVASIACDSVRVVATLSGASTAGADVTSATYSYIPAGRLYRR